MAIRPRLKQRDGEYLYGGCRARPEELGWRFRQNLSLYLKQPGGLCWEPPTEVVGQVEAGEHDALIEATWHDAASAEWYYRYEKDYGRDDPEPELFDDEENRSEE